MARHTKWSKLRDEVMAKPGAKETIARAQEQTLKEIRLYELRHAEAVSQVELAGRLEVTQGAISKFEHADDVRVSTLREYLEALGARLELVAVFDDEERRVPVHLGTSRRAQEAEFSTESSRTIPAKATLASTAKSKKASSAARTSTRRNRQPPGSAGS